jgi:serine/threonine-protein kinase RsbW
MQAAPVRLEASIPSDVRMLAYVSRLVQETVRVVIDANKADAFCAAVDVCLTEAVTNAIQHAHSSDATRPIKLNVETAGGVLTIKIYDTGPGFDMTRVPEPDFEQLREHGRGLFIIRNSMDHVSYTPTNGGNVLEMRKRLDA